MSTSIHRRRRKVARSDQGIDLPPSIVGYNNGSYDNLPLEIQTLHYLCNLTTETEGTSICQPEIIFERFIASISFSGKLKLYEIESRFCKQVPLSHIKPKWICELFHKDASFNRVAATANCKTSYKTENGTLGFVVVATAQREICLVNIFEDDKPAVVFSFSTGILNTSSVTCWITDKGLLHVVIGSKSGCLEEWSININLPNYQESLLWKGSFGTQLQSVLALNNKPPSATLSACISQKCKFGRALKSHSVEVLNRKRLLQEWKAENGPFNLIDYCLWPEVGCEWRQISEGGVGNGEGITFGSNVMCCVDKNRWAAALADGTVGILHAGENDALNWGVKRNSHQASLTYPAMGISMMNLSNKPHLVCCLRGGTVYCLCVETDENESNFSTVFLPPFKKYEGDDFEFLHSFAAGNIAMTGGKVAYGDLSTDSMPIIVYVGDGGIMEVYACGLLAERSNLVAQEFALQEMRENGTIQMLLDALQNMKDDDPLLSQTNWASAFKECIGESTISIDDIIADDANKYENIRSLLISLAT